MAEVAVYETWANWGVDSGYGDFGVGATAYDDITADVKSISIHRGRSSDMGQMQQGTCTIRLRDRTGKYNPENASSPLAGGLAPMRFFFVQATYGAITYRLFEGHIIRIEHNPFTYESIIEAVDLSWYFHLQKPSINDLTGSTSPQLNRTVQYLIELMMTWAGLSGVAYWNLNAGRVISSFAPDGTVNMLSLIGGLLAIDRGIAFFAGDGRLTYRQVSTVYGNNAAVATWTDQMVTGLRATTTVDDMVNDQYVTKTGGASKLAVSDSSATRFGLRTGSPITSDYLVSDAQAQALADWIVETKSRPQSPARSLTMTNGDATRLTQMLARELGNIVTISESKGGTAFTGIIAGIEHDISDGGQAHRTTFAVQKRPWGYFIIGISTIGSQIAGALY